MHADIKYENGDFYLFDHNSKFGTLVLLEESLKITKETVFLQCGKTVVTLRLKEAKAKSPQITQEVLEMQECIGTPSTTINDNEVDSNISKLEGSNDIKQQLETTINKKRGRPKKNVKPMAVDLKVEDISELNLDQENDLQNTIVETKSLSNVKSKGDKIIHKSKKISKSNKKLPKK